MKKFSLSERIYDCYITNARVKHTDTGKYKNEKIIRISSREECVLFKDAIKLMKAVKNNSILPERINVYTYIGGGCYNDPMNWGCEDKYFNYMSIGCQEIYKPNIIKALKNLK